MNRLEVKIIRLDEKFSNLPLPSYMTEGSAGMDIYAAIENDIIIEPMKTKLIPTSLAIELPIGHECQVRSRSGLALKSGIFALNAPGTIDSDYRGEIGVILSNFSDTPFSVKRGDRIAQLVVAKYERVVWSQVNSLEETERAAGGFGSSGIRGELMQNPKIIFMGTPEFAVPAMDAVNHKFGLSAVVTVPDKPQGRGLKLIPSPVKAKAEELGLKIFQPQSLKEENFLETIREMRPDIIVVIAFRILPKELYTLPSIASFNIHGSLLPKYRGAAPINHSIINGESVTGLTSFILQDKVDTGNILLTKETDILPGMTAGELHDKLMPMAAELSIETIDLLLKGSYQTISQNDSRASPAPKLFKENTMLDWNMSSQRVINFIHGLSPHPAAWTIMDGAVLKILKAVETDSNSLEPGQFSLSKKEFLIGTHTGDIKILQLQPSNKKSMPINDFLNGYRGTLQGMMI